MIYLRDDIKDLFAAERTVSDFLRIECEVVRDFKNRQTGRFERGGRAFYIKKHDRCGWGAVFDELSHLRLPHIGAGPERKVLDRLAELGVPTMTVAAFGVEGASLPSQRSFLITDEIPSTINLEDLCRDWKTTAPDPAFKLRLIREVARIAKTLHGNGLNHRDFYICHFLLDISKGLEQVRRGHPELFLIDLHRAQMRDKTPRRWLVKDIAGLYFSAMDTGLSRRDILRFIKWYRGGKLAATLREDADFWRDVQRRAIKLYRKTFGRTPDLAVRI